ncbi:MAG: ATP-binding cassette domain-containing protein, partial [Bacteroidetes bacterium]
SGLATAYPHELSGGQQQRVGLARALAADPPILLMDEPLGALDPITKALIRQEFRELDELKRKTIVWVTHDVQEALELGDRICLMDKGQIRQIGKAAELLFRPADAFVREFFDPQRLQLELSVVSLREAWDYLEDGGSASSPTSGQAPTSAQTPALNMESSLWEALSALSPERTQVSVQNAQGETKHITFSSAQTALNHLKRLY